MIFVDANVFMYAAGAAHAHKTPSTRLLRRVAQDDVEATTDAEVLQELLHRYHAMGRWTDGREVYDRARVVLPTVLPVRAEDMDRARALLDRHRRLSARDAVHAAVCLGSGIRTICSYDRDLDGIPGLRRLAPERVP